MSAIFYPTHDPKNPVRLVNVRTLGARCGTFPTHAEAEGHLRRQGYKDDQFGRDGNTVWFRGGINC